MAFNIFKKAIQLPKYGINLFTEFLESNIYKKNSHIRWSKLSFDKNLINHIQEELQSTQTTPIVITQLDQHIVHEINSKTRKLNQNNVTRTKAYLDFYLKHPEVHWALLAHLVSRNGGWNMTDLKGSILSQLLTNQAQKDFFAFLERANALIFHDAFSQLLLYEESKIRNKNLFFLLPKLHVSSFMKPFWDCFFEKKDSQLLTVALIINEQNYIEKRVVQNHFFREKVIANILFQLQDWLQFTYVLFPFVIKGEKKRLAGTNISDFENVHERIEIGKKLYCILFGIEELQKDILKFVTTIPHSGSRNDYWPKMFTKTQGDQLYSLSFSCKPSQPVVFSPTLKDAWSNVSHTFTDHHDWYQKNKPILDYFNNISTPRSFDLSKQYCQDINKMIAASTTIDLIN